MSRTSRLNCIIPPYLLKKLLKSDDSEVRQAALDTMLTTARLRGERAVRASFAGMAAPGNGRRTVFDCQQEASSRPLPWSGRRTDPRPSTSPSTGRSRDSA
ncbi:hypothetical protein ACFSNO_24915 [Streptomyces cirratus]